MSEELERLIERCKADVERIGESFDTHDDDWMPVMLVHTRDDHWVVAAIDTEFMANEFTKDLLANMVLPGLIRESNGVSAAFVCSAWQSRYDGPKDDRPKPGEEGYLPPSQDPERTECVMIQAMTATEAQLVQAQILRHDNDPPKLADWVVWGGSSNPEEPTVDGRFVTPLRQALAPQG